MKRFALLALSLVLASCKPDTPAQPAEESSDSKPRITAGEHADLIHQKLKLENDLEALMAGHNNANHVEIETLKDRLNQATINLHKVQSEHPALQALNTEIRDWQSHAKNAQIAGDPTSEQAATAEIHKLNQKLLKLAEEQPEIIAARQKIEEINKELFTSRRNIATKIPEAQPILKALDTIDQQLIEISQ